MFTVVQLTTHSTMTPVIASDMDLEEFIVGNSMEIGSDFEFDLYVSR